CDDHTRSHGASTLFPYTTLFRSVRLGRVVGGDGERQRPGGVPRHPAARLTEELGQIAEEGEALERVGRAWVTHGVHGSVARRDAHRVPGPGAGAPSPRCSWPRVVASGRPSGKVEP